MIIGLRKLGDSVRSDEKNKTNQIKIVSKSGVILIHTRTNKNTLVPRVISVIMTTISHPQQSERGYVLVQSLLLD